MRIAGTKILRFLTVLLSGAALLVTSNCGATHAVKYYTLDPAPMPEASAAPTGNAPLPVSILVGRITAPQLYLEHPIVYSTGSMELGAYEYHQWAEIPTETLELMLADSLRTKGQFRSVARIGRAAKGDYILRGHLYALEEIDSPSLAARFSLELELFQPSTGRVVWTQSYSHDEPVSQKSVAAVVRALHQEVLAGIEQLTTSLDAYVASVSPR
ncbi:MAG: ABC-type transport auxiliary lipoprotein family protein [Candidatus Acidiferrales bacterium]